MIPMIMRLVAAACLGQVAFGLVAMVQRRAPLSKKRNLRRTVDFNDDHMFVNIAKMLARRAKQREKLLNNCFTCLDHRLAILCDRLEHRLDAMRIENAQNYAYIADLIVSEKEDRKKAITETKDQSTKEFSKRIKSLFPQSGHRILAVTAACLAGTIIGAVLAFLLKLAGV